jgi:toxin ParE1/3/4
MRLVFSDEAEQDLEAIGDYIAEDSPLRAVSFLKELRIACRGLLDAPMRFSALEGLQRYRRRVYGRYAIIYAIMGDEVLVVRVLSVARDLKAILAGD